LFCEVIEHGRTSGLMAEVPDPFRPTKRRHRVVEDTNEDQLGKALPESVIRRLDAHLGLLGPRGRAGSITAADLQAMHQVIYRILRDTGRRPGEVVSLNSVARGHRRPAQFDQRHHKAARLRRRLPITTETAEAILDRERRRAKLSTPPATHPWLFPSPLLRSRQSLGHLTANCVGVAFRAWVRRIPAIDEQCTEPGEHAEGTPVEQDGHLVRSPCVMVDQAQYHGASRSWSSSLLIPVLRNFSRSSGCPRRLRP
jgi:integrase